MVAECEDELVCDFAETYHVLNWRALRPILAATLAGGLSESSRVMRKLRGDGVSLDTMLRAAILDQLRIANWHRTKDGMAGKNVPKSVLSALMGKTPTKSKKMKGFASPEDFEAWRSQFESGG